MSGARQVVLYGRPECHLCDEARAMLLDLIPRAGPIAYREVDIESDDDLLRSHLERIPVIEVDGVVISALVPERDRISAVLLQSASE